ncbi:MAG: biopolymer transporter ExbD [Limnohabitans sp.]|nr:biopolymer transporter ExbD [Limnohabitans sp.]
MAFGQFESNSKNSPMSEINVTPLVDVMLVLLVIFIITAPLMASALRLNLPQVDDASTGNPPRILTLSLDAKAQLFLNEKPILLDNLPAALQQQSPVASELEVQIRADQQVPYGEVAQIMAVVQQAGLWRIALVTQPRNRGPGAATATKP